MLSILVSAAVAAAAPADTSVCRINGGTEFLRDLLFAQASHEPGAEQGTITHLKRASKIDLINAHVLSYDAASGRIECSGDVELIVPTEASAAFGGKSQLTNPTRFTAEPSGEGNGYIIFASHMAGLSSQIADASKALGPTLLRPVAASAAAPAAPLISVADARPAFDCALATTAVENMLCSDAELAERDRRVAAGYFALRGSLRSRVRSQLLDSQRLFLKERSQCSTSQCLSALYDMRLRRLDQFAASRTK